MKREEKGERDFFLCGNCQNFHQCRSRTSPVEKADSAVGCADFEPKRGYMFQFYISETRQEQDEPLLLFVDPIDHKHAHWWVDYDVGKRQVPRKKVALDFWMSSHQLQQMAGIITSATEGADKKFINVELQRMAKDIDRQGGIAAPTGEEDEEELILRVSKYVDDDGTLYEQIVNPEDGLCLFIDADGKRYKKIETLGGKIVPIPYDDEALQEGAVLLPTDATDYGTLEDLTEEIRHHVHTYLDISEEFAQFSVWYILLSWVYDQINTLPYLRALGDSGTGKSRFLDVIGRLCYKPLIVSGAVTPAPIYRMIRKWGGTLILDEADLRKSDEKNEVVTILNCGFERGRPVIRSQKDNPDDLQILPTFSPKVFATRKRFQDPALESRCLTEIMRETDRDDLPYLLPEKFYEKEIELRNKLLNFRLQNYHKIDTQKAHGLDLGDVEPRLKQTMASFAVLFANINGIMNAFRGFLKRYQRDLIEERANSYDGMLVNALFDIIDGRAHTLPSQSVTNVTDVTDVTPTDLAVTSTHIAERMNELYDMETNCRTVGRHLKGLGLETEPRKVGGGTKRCVVLDPARLTKLRRRYVPSVDENVTANREEVTKVTKVTLVTESEGSLYAQDTRGDVTNVTNVTGEPKDNVQDVTGDVRAQPPTDTVTNVTRVTDVTGDVKESEGFATLVEDVMAQHPAREWTIEDLAEGLEYDVDYINLTLSD